MPVTTIVFVDPALTNTATYAALGDGDTVMHTEAGVVFTLSINNPSTVGGGDASGNFQVFPATTVPGDLYMQEIDFGNLSASVFDASFDLDLASNGSKTRFDGVIKLYVDGVSGNWEVKFDGANTVKIGATGTYSYTGATPIQTITFINSTGLGSPFANLNIDKLSAEFNCFCAGTLIATAGGAVAVEALKAGDRLLTADGRETTVKWLGTLPVNTRLTHPAKVNPICITAGALADGVPARDLWVSGDHAIALNGHLINAGALVNGRTIYQVRDMPLDGFTYYHVETDAHELLLAENTPAESFIDYAGRDSFVNGDERAGAPVIPEMDLPRISDARLVPEALRDRLAARAEDMLSERYAAVAAE